MNKKFELLEFVFDSVYVDLQYDEICLTSIAGSVSLWCVCSHVVFFGLSVKLYFTGPHHNNRNFCFLITIVSFFLYFSS